MIGNQKLHSGVQLSHFVTFSQHVIQTDSLAGKPTASRLGISGHSEAHRAHVSLDSGGSQRGQVGAQEGWNSLQPGRRFHKICSSFSSWSTSSLFEYLQGQFQKVSSKTSLVFKPASATLNIIIHAGDVVSLHVLLQQL